MQRTQQRWGSPVAVIAASLALAACSNVPLYGDGGTPVYGGGNYPASGYPASNYPTSAGYAQWGEVVNVELVRGERSSGTVGTIAGGAIGGLAGHQIGGGTGNTIATVAGAIGGALIGRAIEQNSRQPGEDHYRVTVRLENNAVRTFDYREPPNVRIGERVRVDGNELYR